VSDTQLIHLFKYVCMGLIVYGWLMSFLMLYMNNGINKAFEDGKGFEAILMILFGGPFVALAMPLLVVVLIPIGCERTWRALIEDPPKKK
jgi:threonine/homoserine/homoserine lactone efflux protein